MNKPWTPIDEAKRQLSNSEARLPGLDFAHNRIGSKQSLINLQQEQRRYFDAQQALELAKFRDRPDHLSQPPADQPFKAGIEHIVGLYEKAAGALLATFNALESYNRTTSASDLANFQNRRADLAVQIGRLDIACVYFDKPSRSTGTPYTSAEQNARSAPPPPKATVVTEPFAAIFATTCRKAFLAGFDHAMANNHGIDRAIKRHIAEYFAEQPIEPGEAAPAAQPEPLPEQGWEG